MVPVSISNGVIVASFGDGTGNGWETSAAGSWTPEVTQNSARPVLHQTCVRLRPGHSWQGNVTAVFRYLGSAPPRSQRKWSETATDPMRSLLPVTTSDHLCCSAACRAAQAEATMSSTV